MLWVQLKKKKGSLRPSLIISYPCSEISLDIKDLLLVVRI
jgi:hypothetical protein